MMGLTINKLRMVYHRQVRPGKGYGGQVVPRRGLEPPRCYPLVPETSASTNFATWAIRIGGAMYVRGMGLSIEAHK